MLSWRKISRPSSPAFCISPQTRLRRVANSSRVKCSAIRLAYRSLENSGEWALVEREGLVARRPAALGHQPLHVIANLVEPREPDAALGMHMIEQFQYRLEPGEAARQCRMPDRDPQRA